MRIDRKNSWFDMRVNSFFYFIFSGGGLDSWKEDSSGSEQGKNELDDDFQQETRSLTSNVHFTLGGDS